MASLEGQDWTPANTCLGWNLDLLLHCNILMYVVLTFSSLLQLRSVPPHCLQGLRFVYSQLESLTCCKCISTLEVSCLYTAGGVNCKRKAVLSLQLFTQGIIHPYCVWLHLPSPFWGPTPVSSSVEGFPACMHMCSVVFFYSSWEFLALDNIHVS